MEATGFVSRIFYCLLERSAADFLTFTIYHAVDPKGYQKLITDGVLTGGVVEKNSKV